MSIRCAMRIYAGEGTPQCHRGNWNPTNSSEWGEKRHRSETAGIGIDAITTPYFVVTEGALDALGVKLIAGRDFTPGDWDYDEEAVEIGEEARNVIMTQALADRLFPEGDALGQVIESKGGERVNTIIGVIDTMLCSWPTSDVAGTSCCLPASRSGRRLLYMVRVEPGDMDTVYSEVEDIVRAVNPDRVVTVRTLTEVKLDNFQATLGVMKMLGVVIVLLLVVTPWNCRPDLVLGHGADSSDRDPTGLGGSRATSFATSWSRTG